MPANIASVSRLLDADTVVLGMRPEVAITLVGLGLPGVKTALNAERGLALIGGVASRRDSRVLPMRPFTRAALETRLVRLFRTRGRRRAARSRAADRDEMPLAERLASG